MKWKYILFAILVAIFSTNSLAQESDSSIFLATLENCDAACLERLQEIIRNVTQGNFMFSDYNECAFRDRGNCSDFADCINLIGNHTCECRTGFTDEEPDNPGRNCSDINECLNQTNRCLSEQDNGMCINNNGSYNCTCLIGYEGDGETNCSDIDECVNNLHDCFNNDSCSNTIGSYICSCPPGYTGDGNNCENINECQQSTNLCELQPNTKCVDKDGSYMCDCESGFQRLNSNSNCVNINECNDTSTTRCLENQMCIDTQGSFSCRCKPGYQGVLPNLCIDENECTLGTNTCVSPFRCINLEGSYECICDEAATTQCRNDTNECQNSTLNQCDMNATCTDLPFGYTCICKPGFSGNGITCSDVNECDASTGGINDCDSKATCTNTPGSFGCTCNAGYSGDGRLCLDVDECMLMTASCDINADCINTAGGYNCSCKDGFSGDGDNCTNIDECSSSPCMNSATCIDGVNNYTCECRAGFTGMNCTEDIDECSSNPCMNNATCIDGVNNYTCECRAGFTGMNCTEDIDECSSNPCMNNATCIDGVNNYTCECRAGFTGMNCTEDIDECSSNPCMNNATCIDGVNNYTCECRAGFTGMNCTEDIDECSSNPCMNNATCIDGVNNYTCECRAGFTGMNCTEDIDECSSNPCMNNATCIDGVNNYTCECRAGFTGMNCTEELNECTFDLCLNNATCMDVENNYTCICSSGFTGRNCETNIDDCENIMCMNGGSCEDQISDYRCHCASGFSGTHCEVDVDECLSSPCLFSSTCMDGTNNYTCMCLSGFTGRDCDINIDDCANVTCFNDGYCEDEINDYTCNCAPGYFGEFCKTMMVNCSQDPCLNGGNCTEVMNNFTCSCALGFSGRLCEFDIDDCENITCLNGGSCEDGINNYTCNCVSGYTGRNCETESCRCFPPPPMFLPPPPPTDIDGLSAPPPPIMPPPPPPNDVGITERPPPPPMMPPPPPPNHVGVAERPPPPPMMPPPPPPPTDVGAIERPPPPPMMPPPPPPPTDVGVIEKPPPPPMMPPPPPPPTDVGAIERPPPPPMMPPPPPPPTDVGVIEKPPPPPMMPPPPPPPTDVGVIEKPPPPPMMPPPPPPPTDVGVIEKPPPPPMIPPPPPPPIDIVTESPPPPPMMPPPPPPLEFPDEVCPEGYVRDLDNCTCILLPACSTNGSLCGNGTCIEDENGTYTCECDSGYEFKNGSCLVISACSTYESLCGNGTCTDNENGTYTCECDSEYEFKNGTCVVVSACLTYEGICGNGFCFDYENGTYTCECDSGFEFLNGTCLVFSACSTYDSVCGNGVCIDGENGTYTCACDSGYEFKNSTCLDINECLTVGPCVQLQNVECVNMPGSFQCACTTGYIEVQGVCMDVNECDLNPCNNRTEACFNHAEGYTCACADGFTGVGPDSTCVDRDECEFGLDSCDEITEVCNNTEGSYICNCATGYNATDSGCMDIDQCGDSTLNDCHSNATCVNEPGLFRCECNCGYSDFDGSSRPGTDCVFDSCKYTEHGCAHSCVLQRNGFVCACDEGFRFEGDSCIPDRSCQARCINGVCYLDDNDNTLCRCNNGYEPSQEFPSICSPINQCSGDYNLCQDDCSLDSSIFPPPAACVCRSGYAPAPHAPDYCCEPAVSVCDGTQCSGNGECVDDFTRLERYRCECYNGWEGEECNDDVNECSFGIVICEVGTQQCGVFSVCRNGGTCINLPGNFSCACRSEFNGARCEEDVDECQTSNICSPNASCRNSYGSYSCSCNDGFITPFNGPSDGSVCQELNLLPFGPEFGETVLVSGLNAFNIYSPLFFSSVGFIVGNTRYNRLYATEEGVIVLQSDGSSLRQSGYGFIPSVGLVPGVTLNQEAVVAAFWTDLDSSGFGEISYGFYKRSDDTETSRNVLDSASQYVRDAYVDDPRLSSFNATEVMKVTYYNVPYFPYFVAELRANSVGLTFQTLLMTNGTQTFALTIYFNMDSPDILMQTPLVGYANPSAAFTHPISESVFLSRPDLYQDSLTNRTGIILMKLNGDTERTSPESTCQNWYDTQPDYQEWLILEQPCPFTYFHFLADLEFIIPPFYAAGPGQTSPLRSVVNDTLLTELRQWTDNFCVQSSYNWIGDAYGPTCCYGNRGEFLYGGDLFGGGHEARNLIYDNTESAAIAHLESDVRPGIACCRESISPEWCQKYYEKRPPTTDTNYVTFLIAGAYGDPHLSTLDGLRYSYSGLGEYILMQTNNGNGITVQGRMERNVGVDGSFINASIITSAAITNQENMNPIFQFDVGNSSDSDINNLTIYINRERITATNISTLATARRLVFSDVILLRTDNMLTVFYSRLRTSFNIEVNNRSLTIVVRVPSSTSQVDGLYGVADGNSTNDLRLRNGNVLGLESVQFSPISSPSNEIEARWNTYLPTGWILASEIEPFVESWRINANESLFIYPNETSYDSFNDPSFQGDTLQQLLATASNETLDQAAAACTNGATVNPQCLHDVLVSGDLNRGQSDFELPTGVVNNPPSFIIPSGLPSVFQLPNVLSILATVGETYTFQLNATDPDNDPIVFNFEGEITNDPNAMLNMNGLFTWTPTSANVTNVRFLATDNNNMTSVLQVLIVMCGCENNGMCGPANSSFQLNDNVNRFYVRSCLCTDAYTGLLCEDDLDACLEEPCSSLSNCTDAIAPLAGFTCSACPSGYLGDGTVCTRDVCSTLNCAQNCTNIEGTEIGFCFCFDGFELNNDNVTCDDIDECTINSTLCPLSICRNIPGSFECVCDPGLSLNDNGECVDIDECASNMHSCDPFSTNCTNLVGTYSCDCIDGFTNSTGSNASCVDIDECTGAVPRCTDGTEMCVNTNGSFRCDCLPNTERDASGSCVDIDECVLNSCPSQPIGTCMNFDGSFQCGCIDGYEYNNTANMCMDVNECLNTTACSDGCMNTEGSFMCSCPTGYVLDSSNTICVDRDECMDPSVCEQMCINTNGSFMCSCFDGFDLRNETCVAINPCSANDTELCVNANCFVNGSMPICQCLSGYQPMDDTECIDTDECTNAANDCDNNAICTNTAGSFTCECDTYYADLSGANNLSGKVCRLLSSPPLSNVLEADIGLNSITVRWGIVTLGESFVLYITEEGSSARQRKELNLTDNTYTFIGLMTNTNYTISIETKQGAANSRPNSVSVNTRPDLVPPMFNVINAVTDVTSSSIKVTWTPPTSRFAVEGYRLTIQSSATPMMSTNLSGTELQMTFDGLNSATLYTISIAVTFGINISAFEEIQQNTAPSPPFDLTVTPAAVYGNINLRWAIVEVVIGTNFSVSIFPPGPAMFIPDRSGNPFGIVENLNPGTLYTFTITSTFMNVGSESRQINGTFVPITTTPAPTTMVTTQPEFTTQSTTMESTIQLTTMESTMQPTIVESTMQPTTMESTMQTATMESTMQSTTVESTMQPTIMESTMETATMESTIQPTLEPTMQPTTMESIVQTATMESTMQLTTMESTMQPTVEPTMQPTTMESTMQPTTMESTMQPTTLEPTMQPTTMESIVQTATMESTMQLTTMESTMQPTVEPTMQPTATESTMQPTTMESIVQTATMESTMQPTTMESTMQPTVEPTMQPTTMESTSDSTTVPPLIACPPFMAPVNGICVDSQVLIVELTMNVTFDFALNNPESVTYLDFATTYENLMTVIANEAGFTFINVANLAFSQGSVIARGEATVVGISDLPATQQNIQTAIDMGTNAIIQGSNLTSVTLTDFDECTNGVDNCDANADCTSTTVVPGFTCQCRPEFRDKNEANQGRICEPQCMLDGSSYCMNGGTCTPSSTSDTPACICIQGYTGPRCETMPPEPTTQQTISASTTPETTRESTTTESTTPETTMEPTATGSTTPEVTMEPTTTESTPPETTRESTTTESTTPETTMEPTATGSTTPEVTMEPTTTESTPPETTMESTTTESTTPETTMEPTTTGSTPPETTMESTTLDSTAQPMSSIIIDTTQETSTIATLETTEASTTVVVPTCPPYYQPVGEDCLAAQTVSIQITFGQTFDTNLATTTSAVYAQFSATYIEVMIAISQEAGFVFISVTNLRFISGSVVAVGENILANVNNVEETKQMIENVVQQRNLPILLTNNVTSAVVTDVNDCTNDNFNDCHENAMCFPSPVHPGFTCNCSSEYRDRNITNPGRICELQCLFNGEPFCWNGAECTPLFGTDIPHCTCTQWYTGPRCQDINSSIIAAIVVGILAGIFLIVAIVLIALRLKQRKSETSMSLPYGDRANITGSASLEKYRLSEDEESNLGNSNFGDFSAS